MLPLSPRMALRFLFVAQGEPMAAVLYIDESPVCCFVFAFFEDAAERIAKCPSCIIRGRETAVCLLRCRMESSSCATTPARWKAV